MFKNVASQKVAVFAWDNAAGSAKTGDASNISAQISKDGAATSATDDVNPTELDATDAPGIYIFDMLQTETNADLVVIAPVSSTSDIVLRPIIIYTNPVTPTKAGYIDSSIATAQSDLDELTDAGTLSGVRLALMLDRIYTRLNHEVNVTDSSGAFEIRNTGDTGNIATGTITDDDTTTSQSKVTWA